MTSRSTHTPHQRPDAPGHPTVLLRHDTPQGPHHFDWLLDPDGGDNSPLLTFRVSQRIDRGPATFRAERIADHRRRYLHYEGPLTGGRGSVRRVASGRCLVVADTADHVVVRILLGQLAGKLAGEPDGEGLWRFTLTKNSWPEGENRRGIYGKVL